jgi:hypothetical protein
MAELQNYCLPSLLADQPCPSSITELNLMIFCGEKNSILMCHQINLGEEHQIKSRLCLSLVSCTDKILSALLAAYPVMPRSPPPVVDERPRRAHSRWQRAGRWGWSQLLTGWGQRQGGWWMTSPRHGQLNGRENIAARITLLHGINRRQHTHCHHRIWRRQSAPSASLAQRQ